MPEKPYHKKRPSPRSAGRGRPSVSIIGAGRVGTALGMALRTAGYRIDAVVAKTPASARRAQKLIGGGASLSWKRFTGPSWAGIGCDILIIATPDDIMEQAARELASLPASSSAARRAAFHTSGALPSDVLSPLRKRGFRVASLHPLLSISDPQAGANLLRQAFFSLEGDPAAKQIGRKIVRDLGARSFTIGERDKPLYHAAALMASPNMTALFDIAVEMLSRCGLSAKRSREVLLPLVQSTLDNLVRQDPSRALTGTFKRGDIATVKAHLAAIDTEKLPDAMAAYLLLGRRSIALAGSNRPQTSVLKALLTQAQKRKPH